MTHLNVLRAGLCLALAAAAACASTDPAQLETTHPAHANAPVPQPTEIADPVDVTTPVSAGEPDLGAAEQQAYQQAKSVFETRCAKCHGVSGSKKAKKHFAMEGYPFASENPAQLGAAVRTSIGAEGTRATMPADNPGSLKPDEVALLVEWSRAYDAAHASNTGHHQHHGH